MFHKVPTATLLGFGSQFGALFSREWNSDSSGYIHSRVHARFLINLSITSFVLSRALKFITFCTSRKLQFLYFLDEGFAGRLFRLDSAARFWKQNFFLIERWIPGTLTNYKVIRDKLMNLKRYTNFFNYANVFIHLNSSKFSNIVSAEARVARLPSVGLVDTDNGFSPFSYSIPSNNKMFSVFYIYYNLFFQSSKIGWTLQNISSGNFFNFKIKKIVRKFSIFLRLAAKRSDILFNRWKKLHLSGPKFKLKKVFRRKKQKYGSKPARRTISAVDKFKFVTTNLDLFFDLKKIRKRSISNSNKSTSMRTTTTRSAHKKRMFKAFL